MMTICNKAHDMSTKLLMPGDECKERSKKGVAVLIQRQGMMEDKIKEPQSDCINALRVQRGPQRYDCVATDSGIAKG